jgi:hypothetical protein
MRGKDGRIVSLILALLLIFAVFSCAQVYGGTETIIEIVPPPIDVKEGQNFLITIDIHNVVDMVAFQFKISWDPEYLEYVSHEISPPWRPPIIILPPEINQAEGYLIIGASSADARFSGDATLATVTFHALKSGAAYITISDVIIEPPTAILTEDATVTILPSNTWVSATGIIYSYGSDDALGMMNIFAMEGNWSEGLCAFSVPPLGPITLIYPPPPLNFTLYIARIVDASTVKLGYNGYDMWISGLWGVSNVTNPRTIRDIGKLIQNTVVAPGELGITENWTLFAINIEGFESIQGNITHHCIRDMDNADERFPRCDINNDFRVNMRDIGMCCDAFGSTFGFSRYNFSADVNSDLQVNMRDIGTCCNAFGKNY